MPGGCGTPISLSRSVFKIKGTLASRSEQLKYNRVLIPVTPGQGREGSLLAHESGGVVDVRGGKGCGERLVI